VPESFNSGPQRLVAAEPVASNPGDVVKSTCGRIYTNYDRVSAGSAAILNTQSDYNKAEMRSCFVRQSRSNASQLSKAKVRVVVGVKVTLRCHIHPIT
jgi:hypothetical protein